nr:RNA-directed DNA polymerase, eukaryota [Tanacetum cinerariifolium]
DGVWVDDPSCVKEEFRSHFEDRFNDPGTRRGSINFRFPNWFSIDQVADLESAVSDEEIRKAVWGCGENKSPGPDGFTFEFFRKFWEVMGLDFCIAVKWFFDHGAFATGCNSSFVTLIPKSLDPKLVSEFRPISLIGSLYKVITKILATRLSYVISNLISNVQTAFLPNCQILDGPFILNEILARCKHIHQQAMFLKVDFAKAYDLVRWDYLDDVLNAFGFGTRWRSWIQGMSINLKKSHILGLGVHESTVSEAATRIGCSALKTSFNYLGIMLQQLVSMLDSVILSTSNDRWIYDLNGDGIFRVKDVRNLLDEFFLLRVNVPTRWVNVVPIKVNIFAWKLALDRLPTRANLALRGVVSYPLSCLICESHVEDSSHLFFNCSLAKDVMSLVCHWWDVGVPKFTSYAEWLVWFNAIRLGSKLKIILEG